MLLSTQFCEHLEAIVMQAGYLLVEHQNMVTSADVASEQYLIKELSALFPEASFLAEEQGAIDKQSDYCWVIDPLDGTTNFVHGFPHCAVSVALTYKNIPQVGVIYDPLRQELLYAQKGKGAWLNGERIQTPLNQVQRNLILIATPYKKDTEYAACIERLLAHNPERFAFRTTGSIALDCAYVACGRADGLFFMNLNWWDIAAGILMIQEAGREITGTGMASSQGKPYPLLLAGTQSLVGELGKIIGHEY